MGKSHSRILRSLLLALAVGVAPARAQQPATAPVVEETLKATVTGVEGVVQVRPSPDAPWQKAAVGMELGEGAEFRTGPRSAVRFTIPPEQTITLDRLGTVKLIEAVRSSTRVKTDLGMQYGRVRYDIEAAGQEHDSTIYSPSSALAVRGTRVSLYDQAPFKPEAVSLTGVAQFKNLKKQNVRFGAKGKNQKQNVTGDANSAAETAQATSLINDFAVTQSDQQARELAYLFRNQGAAFGGVATSNTPVPDADLPQLFTGRLNFVLRWSSSSLGDFSDLNLAVSNTKGETFGNPPFIFSLFPNNPTVQQFLSENFPQTSPSGGSVGLNHIGPEGIEIATFGSKAPTGTFLARAYNFLPPNKNLNTKGLPKVPFRMEVFLDGKRQDLILNLPEVLSGEEEPEFGKVFRDRIAVGEAAETAVNIRPLTQAKNVRKPGAQPAKARPAQTKVPIPSKPARPETRTKSR